VTACAQLAEQRLRRGSVGRRQHDRRQTRGQLEPRLVRGVAEVGGERLGFHVERRGQGGNRDDVALDVSHGREA